MFHPKKSQSPWPIDLPPSTRAAGAERVGPREACGFSAGSAVPELLACPAFAELQPLSPIRGRVQDAGGPRFGGQVAGWVRGCA